MESAFSREHTNHYYPYSVVSPSVGHSLKRTPAQFHPAHLRRGIPLLIYSHATEPRLYDASYPDATVSLMPYLGQLNGHFMYNCVFEPALIQKRNERERLRVKCVNQGYAKLRQHLPGATNDKRMSKVETLRSAIHYIKHLQRLVDEHQTPTEDASSEGKESIHKLAITSFPVHHQDASRDSSRT